MNFSIENRGNVIIFSIKQKRIDSESSATFKAQMLIVSQPDIEALVIDFTYVESIDSAGLGALLLAHRQVKEYDTPIILVGVKGMVKSLLSISQTESLFDYYDTIEDAFKDLEEEEGVDNPEVFS